MRACMRGTGGRVCGGYLFAFAPVMLHVVLMLFQEINKHSYGRLCVLLSRWRTLYSMTLVWKLSILAIGLYRENAIAIESEARDPFGGNVYYVTMQITFPIPEFPRKERNLHCDVVHVTTKWVSRLVLDHAIAAIQTSR